tara:strand:- start:414 stop:611 length:198 start_codon:yes stop_codon:yes gene_type:complete
MPVEVLVVVTVMMVLLVDLVEEVQVVVPVLSVELPQEIKLHILEQEQQQDMEVMAEKDIIIPLLL